MPAETHTNLHGDVETVFRIERHPAPPDGTDGVGLEDRVGVRLSPDDVTLVDRLAAQWGCSRSDIIRQAIRAFCGGGE